ncbi:MAG: serine/threonine-protein kinase [Eggerthellaceae bacterium]|nr:serine/threonine-protein kinase [Eggerthellaceae bacterium]
MAAKLILGKYEPRGEVGSGGSASVIEAWDTVILRKVAIKCISLGTRIEAIPSRPDELAPHENGVIAQQRFPRHAAPTPSQQAKLSQSSDGSPIFLLPWEDEQDAMERFARTNPTKVIDQKPVIDHQEPEQDVLSPVRPEARFAQPAPLRQERVREPSLKPVYAVSDQTPGLDEARAVAKLVDENIVTLYDFGVEGNTAYLVMEYVEGVTLKKFLSIHDAELTLDTIAAVFDSVAHALEVAHANKVLHLDIKPDNILINPQGQVKVTDFGLASLTDFQGYGHAGGGTIGYMPPEQMHREALDARCDEWAFASILYQMLVGENPFVVPAHNPLTFEDLELAEKAIRETDLVLPSYLWNELNPTADDVLFCALDPDRERRFRSIAQFADAMAPLLGDPDAGYEDIRQMMAADAAAAENLKARQLPEPAKAGNPDLAAQEGLASDYEIDEDQSGLKGIIGKIKRAHAEHRQNVQLKKEIRQREASEDNRAVYYDDPYPERYAPPVEEQPELSYDDYEEDEPKRPKSNPFSRLRSDKVFSALGRIFAALGSALVATIGYANIPQFGGFDNPIFLIMLAGFAVVGLFVPFVSAGLAFLLLAAALCVNGSYVLGALFVIATVGWWFACARHGKAVTNSALAFPFMGAFGFAQIAPLVSGYCLRTVDALITTVYGILIALTLAGFGTSDLLNWDAVNYFHIQTASVQGAVLGMLMLPKTWCIIVSWLLSAVIVALGCSPKKRVLAGFACILGLLVILFGISAAQWLASGQTQVFPPTNVLIPTMVFGVVIIAAAFTKVPERSRNS